MDDASSATGVRLRVKVGAVIVLALVALGCAVLVSMLGSAGSTTVASRDGVVGVDTAGAEGATSSGTGVGLSELDSGGAAGAIFVHILGAVAKPGLYELRDGDRAVDAVAAAGGFAENADQAQLNLARFLSDGEQIIVPVIGAVPPPGTSQAGGSAGSGKVNINTADAAALETLPRVGPALADRIIAWRDTNGRFTAIEDLMSVTGIGDKTFEGLRDLVTI